MKCSIVDRESGPDAVDEDFYKWLVKAAHSECFLPIRSMILQVLKSC